MVGYKTFPEMNIVQGLFFGQIEYVNDADDVFEERGEELVFVDFACCVPETSGEETVAFGLDGSPELSA